MPSLPCPLSRGGEGENKPRLVAQNADFGDSDDESKGAENQEPPAAVDRHNDANGQNSSHDQPDQNC